MDPLIRLQGVSKFYPRVHHPWERMRAFTSLLAGREPQQGAEVLHDVSIEVQAGESFGVIGENGAGKSTLLKILTGVISPSNGSVEVNARVAALLELGAGFQPEFSGFDNVKMKAALLGMKTRELDERMDSILSFADIGEYIHEPVKHYSSGMVVRLGFAVVAASRPELLITDEVLAVGDESFQKKCISWIESFLSEGNTLLMVSHSMYQVQKLCHKALWLHEGKVRQQGEVFAVTQAYLAYHESKNAEEREHRNSLAGDDGIYRIAGFRVLNEPRGSDFFITAGQQIEAELVLHSPDGREPAGMFGIVRADGTSVYGVSSDAKGIRAEQLDPHSYRYRLRFRNISLLPGAYTIRAHALDPEGLRLCDTAEQQFSVTGESRELGLVRLEHEWNPREWPDDNV
jgi:lipopolysaccharide transport system ATP-binding protein